MLKVLYRKLSGTCYVLVIYIKLSLCDWFQMFVLIVTSVRRHAHVLCQTVNQIFRQMSGCLQNDKYTTVHRMQTTLSGNVKIFFAKR